MPEELKITLPEALEKSDDLRKLHETDPEIRKLLDLAMRIEGLARNVGTHAAAVVIADRPLSEYVPLQHVQNKEEIITQWAMADVERAGLLKMDFLGLRNLTILSKVVELIEQTTGEKVDPYSFPLDDEQTFALLCRGETKGVFQLESGGIRELLQRMQPDHFRDVIATNALYRPGPLEGGMVNDYIQVKHGRKQAEYKHPVMKEVLEETHGVMVYQEQVMRILNRLGGISLANAYSCIKAISKKKLEAIAKFREEFIAGAHEQGLSKKEAGDLFGLIEKFAGYGFNKSHSTAYALIAYATAYLKAHYPVEFMAALLTSDIPAQNFKKKDSLIEHLDDCQRMKIEVVPPDVNRSDVEFTVGEGKIFFALSAIKGCGGAAAAAIVRPAEARRTVPQPLRLLRAARSWGGQPHGRRGAGESRRDGRPRAAAPAALRPSTALAGRGLGRFRPPQRTNGPLWRRRSRASSRRRRLAQRSRLGAARAVGQGEGSPRLLSLQPSAGRARKDPGRLLLAHDRGRGRAKASHGSHARRNGLGGEILAHEEPQARQPQPLRHVRSGGRPGDHPLHPLARSIRPLWRTPGVRRHPHRSRGGRQAAGQRRSQPHRQRDCWTSRTSTPAARGASRSASSRRRTDW